MTRRVLSLALIAVPALAGDWIRVASPRIEVITDAGEKTGRNLLTRFEKLRAVFHQTGIGDSPLPLRAFVFASETEFHGYRDDAGTAGFYKGGERDYIALYAGPQADRVALHEYVHMVLHYSQIALPVWFEEGTSDLYSNAQFDGNKLHIGDRIEGHRARLATEKWLTAGELASKRTAEQRTSTPIFYAESWALMHMLNLSPEWRDGMPRFILLLAGGGEPEDALRQAFGKSMEQALAAAQTYFPSIQAVTVAMEPISLDAPKVERMTAIDAAIARADLALHVDRPALARSLITGGRQESAALSAAMGGIELAENHPDAARAQFEKAIALGSRDPEIWFQYATLDRRDFVGLLAKVIEIDPDFAEAQLLIGERLTDDGALEAAIEHLKNAVRVRPHDSFYWHALGFAQAKAGRVNDALESARRARAVAETEQQEAMADALIAMAQEPPPVRRREGPDVITPSSWNDPKGDARIVGVLAEVECGDGFAQLHVADGAGKTVELMVHHPDRVRLENAPGGVQHSFQCGAQHIEVAIEYISATAEVTRIEFRP